MEWWTANRYRHLFEVGLNFATSERREDQHGKELWPYRELIGSLMYLSVGTRPDISNTVSKLAQFTTCPSHTHWISAKRVLRYLKKTIDYRLTFRKTGKSLIGYSDADWGNCSIDRKSYSGYCFILGGAAISWRSQKQRTVATSSTEAEYISLSEAMKEALYLNRLLKEVGLLELSKTTLYADNQGAIYIANDTGYHTRSKHIDIRYHFIRDVLKSKTVELEHLPTNLMLADVFTKALPVNKHYKCTAGLGLIQSLN